MAVLMGFEPTISAVTGLYPRPLSDGTIIKYPLPALYSSRRCLFVAPFILRTPDRGDPLSILWFATRRWYCIEYLIASTREKSTGIYPFMLLYAGETLRSVNRTYDFLICSGWRPRRITISRPRA